MTRKISQLCESSSLTELKLYQFGSLNYTSDTDEHSTISAHYNIFYIAEGRGEMLLGNNSYSLTAGTVFVVFPNQIKKFSTDSSMTVQYIEIDGSVLAPEFARLELSAKNPLLSLNVAAGTGRTAEYFSKLTSFEGANEARLLGLCWTILGSMMEETAQIKPTRAANQRKEYVEQAKDMIHRMYMHDITVEDIADHCGLNRSYLGKLFRDETGESTQEYLIRYRMSVACHFLADTTAPIGTVAMSVGYQNQLHFSRAFHKTYGISPREWQKQERMKHSMA